MTWNISDPQGDEAGKIKYLVVPYTRGVGLDLGCGPRKAFPHFIGVDSCKDTELFGVPIRPDVKVATCERLDEFEPASCDFVFSSHLLEHIEDYRTAVVAPAPKDEPCCDTGRHKGRPAARCARECHGNSSPNAVRVALCP